MLNIFECINNTWEKKRVKVLYTLPCVDKEETIDSTDSALDKSVSSLRCMNFCLYVQDFEPVPGFFHLVIHFHLSYNLLCAIPFGKYSQLTKNIKVKFFFSFFFF